jgi:2,4-dienoyl-CoA reductase-like NADH-dependent reductase (Old Yellow Enzyme family)
MPHLYEPLALRGLTLRNRIGVSPMCQYSSEDGFANDWHLVHLGARASGGAGLILTEATAVEPRGRISPQDLGIWKDAHIDKLRQITDFIHSQGASVGVQLAHAGRKGSKSRPWEGNQPLGPDEGGYALVGPTDAPFDDSFPTPQALTNDEIHGIRDRFVEGARRALAAGFDTVEIHAAHGYLLHSFYSPLSNTRTDTYGGDFEGRIRFTIEVTEAIRGVWPDDKPIIVRISAADWAEGGWTVDDSVMLAKRLKDAGADLIDCSSGGVMPGLQIPVGANYQVPLAEAVRHGADVPTTAVGMITEPMQADAIVRNGQADMVLLGREMLRDPYWAQRAAPVVHQSKSMAVPPQYRRAH